MGSVCLLARPAARRPRWSRLQLQLHLRPDPVLQVPAPPRHPRPHLALAHLALRRRPDRARPNRVIEVLLLYVV